MLPSMAHANARGSVVVNHSDVEMELAVYECLHSSIPHSGRLRPAGER